MSSTYKIQNVNKSLKNPSEKYCHYTTYHFKYL